MGVREHPYVQCLSPQPLFRGKERSDPPPPLVLSPASGQSLSAETSPHFARTLSLTAALPDSSQHRGVCRAPVLLASVVW